MHPTRPQKKLVEAETFLQIAQFCMKKRLKTKVDKISGQMGVQDAGENGNGTTGRKHT